ncbi:MAG: hypothetical protein KC416_17450, partial [Myxococcales bacterium]|nr:hypothetical protein [Myxococcales bacterium]
CDERGDLCAGPNERCGGTGVLVDGTATPWRQCVARRPCDPLAPAAVCEPGEACYVVSDQGDTDCRLEGSGALGDTCTESTDCGEGLVCAGLVGSTCKRICEVGQGGCSGGESCVQQVYTPAGRGVCTKG